MALKDRSEIRNWVIYIITNPHGRIYVGKTVNFKARIRCYKCEKSSIQQPLIYRSFKKYGFDNHKFEILETFSSDNYYCNERERYWVNEYKSNINKYPEQKGMNLTDGGDGTSGFKKSDAERAAMVIRYTGRKMSEENKQKVRELHTGKQYCLGMKHTQETKDKMSSIKKGKPMPALCLIKSREAHIKSVLVYNSNGIIIHEFDSLTNCAMYFNSSRDTISNIINNKTKRPNFKLRGLVFKYKQNIGYNSIKMQKRVFNLRKAV